ncbi:hypothetical protein CLV98_10797 [Dyadobacter jejuensis]|uniref:DDE family transposase n=1 Tax=Dyadobacter jejuensis TaxID=1082580 RepID=A0A316AKJ1_9BACT|nr:hypothetical protein CLV98_10797 [Dyadobacter jejuensis]
MSPDSENYLFKMIISGLIQNLLERGQFNQRRRRLLAFTEQVRLKLAHKFTELEDYFIVDSMPLEICKMTRHKMVKICKEDLETAPEKCFVHRKTPGFSVICNLKSVQFLEFFLR